jgi:hypothetical protein
MTKEDLEAVLNRVRALPATKQAEVAVYLDWLERQDGAPYILSPEEEADLDEALAEMDRGEVASPEEVARVFGR